MISDRTIQIEDTEKGRKQIVAIDHLRIADPLEIILGNSNLDIVRGRSKLYLQADDLLDLNWPEIDSAALLSESTRNQATEASRDRANDSGLQATDNTEILITSSDDENPATDQAAEQVETQIADPPGIFATSQNSSS
jgi:hypothetical protein